MNFTNSLRDELCCQLMRNGLYRNASILDELTDSGMTDRGLYLDVLASTARHMGELWDDDRASFLYVQCAMRRIESNLRAGMPPEPTRVDNLQRNAIFATLPNESHTIGLGMAASIQRSKGWNIRILRQMATRPLVNAIQEAEATILGISIGTSKSVRALYALVDLVKARRPDIRILVSGSLVAMDPKPFQQLGVEAFTSKFTDAERILEGFAAASSGAISQNTA